MIEDGIAQTHVARELGISPNTLSSWKREYLADTEHAFPGHGKQKPDDEELNRLRRENARLKRELEILKKAIRSLSYATLCPSAEARTTGGVGVRRAGAVSRMRHWFD